MESTTRQELSFDGKGINGPDEYRSRIATFANAEAAEKYGRLFAAAPDMYLLAERVIEVFGPMQDKGQCGDTFDRLLERARDCAAKATAEEAKGGVA